MTIDERVAAIRAVRRHAGVADPFPELEGVSYLAALSAYHVAERERLLKKVPLSHGRRS
jgi:hypothetical protein